MQTSEQTDESIVNYIVTVLGISLEAFIINIQFADAHTIHPRLHAHITIIKVICSTKYTLSGKKYILSIICYFHCTECEL